MKQDSNADPVQSATAADSNVAIRTRSLERRFGDTVAVAGIDLDVPRGSFFGFLGPNGAGKSTTVRLLTGLLPPTAGDALIEGRSIQSDPTQVKRTIGVVPDDLALFDRLSLWEHLTMVGRIYDLGREETASRGGDLLRLLDLWDDRGTVAGEASHGMRKKLALAMALIHSPRVLFLDEPFEGIDPIAGRHIRALLARLSERGVTVFLTSHILEIIERLADRVAIIVKGRIALDASLDELRSRGQSLDAAFSEVAGDGLEECPDLPWL